jgi:hypothetical protein
LCFTSQCRRPCCSDFATESGSERLPGTDGGDPAGAGWGEYRRRGDEPHRDGRGKRTGHSAVSRAGIGADGHDRTHAIPRYAATDRFVLPEGRRYYWKSAFLKGLTDDVIDLTIETVRTSPSPMSTVLVESYGGAVARVANDATAFGNRDAKFNLSFLRISQGPASDAEQMAWARVGWQRIRPFSTGGAT